MKNKRLLSNTTSIFLGVGIVTAILAICFFVFHVPDFWPQLLAIIASAFLGAGATAWITNTLLKNQQASEEAKEKNIKVYENKIQVYSEFISKMWKTLEDDVITDEEIRGIRSDIFNKLVFYLKKDDVVKLGEKVKNIKSTESLFTDDNAKEEARKSSTIITCFSEITELLRADVNDSDNTSTTEEISRLWNNFGVQPRDTIIISDDTNGIIKEEPDSIGSEAMSTLSINNGFWHFAMLGANEQIGALRNGIYELNLIEYGEEWRTNLIKQVKHDDLIFLFRSGGWGYMGVFRAVGWRIFEFCDDEKVVETLNIFGKPTETITDEVRLAEDLQRSDIYKSKEDGADLCSSLIVEPLAFAKNGVGNPGGVYRRTISRYDHGYGLQLLERFMAIMDDPDNYDVHSDGNTTVKMGCNREKFTEFLKSGDIKPAEIDKNGNWK